MWHRKAEEVRSSGWSGAEVPISDVIPGFDLGRRAGISESLDCLRTWHCLLEKNLSERPSDVILQMKEQSVRIAIEKLEGLL